VSALRFIPLAPVGAAILPAMPPATAQQPKAFARGDAKAGFFPDEEERVAAFLDLNDYRFAP